MISITVLHKYRADDSDVESFLSEIFTRRNPSHYQAIRARPSLGPRELVADIDGKLLDAAWLWEKLDEEFGS